LSRPAGGATGLPKKQRNAEHLSFIKKNLKISSLFYQVQVLLHNDETLASPAFTSTRSPGFSGRTDATGAIFLLALCSCAFSLFWRQPAWWATGCYKKSSLTTNITTQKLWWAP
jgi:hypothetical protein